MRNTVVALLFLGMGSLALGQGRIAPNGMGLDLRLSAASAVLAELGPLPAGVKLVIRLRVGWTELEPQAGSYAVDDLSSTVGRLAGMGYLVVVAVDPSENPHAAAGPFPSAEHEDYRRAWLALCQELARRVEGMAVFEIPLPWFSSASPEDGAYLLKKTAVLVTGVRAGSQMALGGIGAAGLPTLEGLFALDVSAYVDLYLADAGGLTGLTPLLDVSDPGAEVWASGLAPIGRGPGSVMKPCLVALRDGFGAGLVAVEGGVSEAAAGLATLSASLPSTLAAMPGTRVPVLGAGSAPVAGADAMMFFDAKSLDTVVAWWGEKVESAVVLALETADVGRPELLDPLGKKEPALIQFGKDNDSRKAAAGVPLRGYPLLARFPREVSQDIAFEPVKMEVSGTEELPVAEIIARYQRFQAEQDERLVNFIADERISLHYEVSAGTTIDVQSDNVFYFERGGATEWRETSFYVNGVKWRWGTRPKLPLIQPEKVQSVPLVIALGKTYDYQLKGSEKVDDHDCYVVAFAPKDPADGAFSGRVWIDRRSFARIKMSVVQTGLEPPVISNEESQMFRPIVTPAGDVWLAHRIEGQQIFSIAGSSTPMVREVDFENFRVNDDGFAAAIAQAHQSPDIMFRETQTGYRYLDLKDGERVVNNEVTRSSLFGAAGVFYEQDLDFPLPLLGVNYFNFDFLHTGSQFNLFFAGALVTATINKPDLWGNKQLSGDFIGVFVPLTDTLYEGDQKRPEQDVKVLHEIALVRLGLPFANFFRVNAAYILDYFRYSEADDTAKEFILPQDHLAHGLSLGVEYKRGGYRVLLDGSYTRRSSWELWGNPDGRDYAADDRAFVTGSLTAAKDFYLPKFMRLHVDLGVQGGERLDRFSKWSFGYFSNRVRGFAGSGVRYQQGGLARAYYGFNLGEVIRLDANFDYARVRDRDVFQDDLSFFGTGLTATLMGPWKTIITLDYGYGLHSDIPGLEHESEYRLVLLKVFK